MAGCRTLRKLTLVLAVSSVLVWGCARPHFPGYIIEPIEPETPPGGELSLPTPDSSDPNRRCRRITEIEVRKAERALLARCADGDEVRLRAALGREPKGPKLRQGDMRTPEGRYFVAGPARASKYHMFVPIDYPAEHDAERALELGLISKDQHDAIVAARSQARLPPQQTPLGGHLGLHGEGPRWQGDSAGLDWTYGCVGLTDHDIEFLATRIEPGTPVTILP